MLKELILNNASKLKTTSKRLSFASLAMAIEESKFLLGRDMTELSKLGIVNDDIITLTEILEEYKAISKDEVMLSKQMFATRNKNKAKENIKIELRNLIRRASFIWNNSDVEIHQFHADEITKANDVQIVHIAESIAELANNQIESLNIVGIKQADIDDLKTNIFELISSINAQKTAISNRDIETQNRQILAQKMSFVTRCIYDVGRIAYSKKNEAKNNDYTALINQKFKRTHSAEE